MSRQRSMEVIQQSEYVTIGELVRLTDMRYSTLKFYTEEGMISFEQAEHNLTRRYRREESLERIRRVRRRRFSCCKLRFSSRSASMAGRGSVPRRRPEAMIFAIVCDNSRSISSMRGHLVYTARSRARKFSARRCLSSSKRASAWRISRPS